MITGTCKVARHYQIVVPKHIRELIGLVVGDLVSFKLKEDGEITLVPVEVKQKDQRYFWTRKWQKMATKSESEIKKGHFKRYRNGKELAKAIEK